MILSKMVIMNKLTESFSGIDICYRHRYGDDSQNGILVCAGEREEIRVYLGKSFRFV